MEWKWIEVQRAGGQDLIPAGEIKRVSNDKTGCMIQMKDGTTYTVDTPFGKMSDFLSDPTKFYIKA